MLECWTNAEGTEREQSSAAAKRLAKKRSASTSCNRDDTELSESRRGRGNTKKEDQGEDTEEESYQKISIARTSSTTLLQPKCTFRRAEKSTAPVAFGYGWPNPMTTLGDDASVGLRQLMQCPEIADERTKGETLLSKRETPSRKKGHDDETTIV